MDKNYLITGKPAPALIAFTLPMIIGGLFQRAYTMVDSAVVGRFVSIQALAAVGASYALTNIFICVATGAGNGASVVVGQLFGSRDFGRMKRAVNTSLSAFLCISIILGAIGLFGSKGIMNLLNTPEDVIELAVVYLRIYFLGLPFLFMYNMLSAMFNALGKSHIPLFFLILSSLSNIFLDILFVTRFHYGVAGVAWATLIAQGISAVLSYLVLLKEIQGICSEPEPFYDHRQFVQMMKIAIPSILQQSTVNIGLMLVQSVVNGFGSDALAGFSAAMRIESLAIATMNSMGVAFSTYTAQNIGAGKKERVPLGLRDAFLIVACMAVPICVLLECFHTQLISLFLGDNATSTSLATGSGYLKFMGWFFALIGWKMTVDGLLRGSGDLKMFTIANLANLTIRVVFAMTMAPRYGIDMVWVAVPIGWLTNLVISSCEYRTGKWKRIHTLGN